MMLFAYNVTITHAGDCEVQISRNGDKDFYTIKNIGECGKTTGLRTAFIELPEEEGKCTFRFKWIDGMGNNYLNCADIEIKKPHDTWYSKRRSPGTARRRF
jgi:hypothetical protein